MSLKCTLAAAAVFGCTSAFADTLNGGTVGSPDPAGELLSGLHTADGSPFIDTFDFVVTSPRSAAATFLEAAFDLTEAVGDVPFVFTALVLADASNTAVAGAGAIDTDGSNGWSVFAELPSAGTYRVLLQGTAPVAADQTQSAFYLGALSTQVNVVPEPATYGLMAMGLLVLLGSRRRV